MKELILGGARSGKSGFAERLVRESGWGVTLIATAQPGDAEMAARIRRHRANRPADWRVVEEPLALAGALRAQAANERCLLVDCLTLWLSNLLHAADDSLLARERMFLLETVPVLPGRIIFVSNEVGMGIVPMGELTRRFCDEAGRLHQDIARVCDRVTFIAAGLPLVLKPTGVSM